MNAGGANRKASSKIQSKSVILHEYRQRLRDNIKSLTDNFHLILNLAKVEDVTHNQNRQIPRVSQYAQDELEMEIRAANMARAAESLSKLIGDLKLFLILNDFSFVNDAIDLAEKDYITARQESENCLVQISTDITVQLHELEQEKSLTDASKPAFSNL